MNIYEYIYMYMYIQGVSKKSVIKDFTLNPFFVLFLGRIWYCMLYRLRSTWLSSFWISNLSTHVGHLVVLGCLTPGNLAWKFDKIWSLKSLVPLFLWYSKTRKFLCCIVNWGLAISVLFYLWKKCFKWFFDKSSMG